MVSTSGTTLLPPSAVSLFRTRILPLTTLLTPNIPEAKLLLRKAGVPWRRSKNSPFARRQKRQSLPDPSYSPAPAFTSTNKDEHIDEADEQDDEIRTLPDLVALAEAVGHLMHENEDATNGDFDTKDKKNGFKSAILLKGGHMPMSSHHSSNLQSSTHQPPNRAPDKLTSTTDDDKTRKSLEADKSIFNVLHFPNSKTIILRSPFHSTPHTHGTGCSLASAIAANMASDSHLRSTSSPTALDETALENAVRNAIGYVSGGIRSGSSWQLGREGGNGPIDHLWREKGRWEGETSAGGGDGDGDGKGKGNEEVVSWEWSG